MKKILYAILITAVFVQCEKNEPIDNIEDSNKTIGSMNYPDFIIAGDSNNITRYILQEKVKNLKDGDSIASWYAGSSSSSVDTPLDIDEDEKLDIRYGTHNYLMYNVLIYRALYFSNNYGNEQNYEFAIMKQDTIGIDNDTISFAKLFNIGDTISSNEYWYSTRDPSIISNKFFLSYYFDYEAYDSIRNFSNTINVKNNVMSINESVSDKYVGFRKKVFDDYNYGYIKLNFENFNNFEIVSCGFAD